MTHLDPDAVSQPSDERVEQLLRSMTEADVDRREPPAGLFGSILDALGDEIGPMTGGTPDAAPPTAHPTPTAPTGGNVVSLDARRRSIRTRFLAAAAAVAVVAGVGGYLTLRDDSPAAPTTRTLAAAQLEQLEPLGSTKASARLVDEDGRTHLVITASDMAPPPEGSEYELWLIDKGVTNPRSLGVVTGSEDIVVPSTIDPNEYPIVDISLEPRDGNHQHSGHSLMRGTLQ